MLQDREGWLDCVYLDLKKAFDKVALRHLFLKSEHIGGLKSNILKWLKDYLKNK